MPKQRIKKKSREKFPPKDTPPTPKERINLREKFPPKDTLPTDPKVSDALSVYHFIYKRVYGAYGNYQVAATTILNQLNVPDTRNNNLRLTK